jgi:hypothetical protein
MPLSIETLGIERLSVSDRLELIRQIGHSLPELVNPDEVPDWHLTELALRRGAADASPMAGKPCHDSLARFGGRL